MCSAERCTCPNVMIEYVVGFVFIFHLSFNVNNIAVTEY